MPNVVGHISQIIGPVVDVHFDLTQAEEKNELPNIHDALTITRTEWKEADCGSSAAYRRRYGQGSCYGLY